MAAGESFSPEETGGAGGVAAVALGRRSLEVAAGWRWRWGLERWRRRL